MGTQGTNIIMKAGTFNANSTSPSNLTAKATSKDLTDFQSVKFPEPFPAGYTVVVHLQTQTFNGPNTPGIRIAEVSEDHFRWRFNEVVVQKDGAITALSDGNHNSERLGYVAFGYEDVAK